MHKNYLFEKKSKNLFAYILPLLLSIWGIGNVLYWEVYKGYSACNFCKWHRGCYIALFIFLLMFFKFKTNLLKFVVWLILTTEMIVSVLQVYGNCNPLVCRYVSFNEKLNLSFGIGTFILMFIFELRTYLKHHKRNY